MEWEAVITKVVEADSIMVVEEVEPEEVINLKEMCVNSFSRANAAFPSANYGIHHHAEKVLIVKEDRAVIFCMIQLNNQLKDLVNKLGEVINNHKAKEVISEEDNEEGKEEEQGDLHLGTIEEEVQAVMDVAVEVDQEDRIRKSASNLSMEIVHMEKNASKLKHLTKTAIFMHSQ
jgi:hypothetical protein